MTTQWSNLSLIPQKLTCCTSGGSTCQYKRGSPECHAAMREICRRQNNGGRQECKDWARAYPQEAESAVVEYCRSGNRINDPWCGCVLSKANNAGAVNLGGQINPFCVDKQCISIDAFHPYSWTVAKCPDVIDCTQIVNMKNYGIAVAPSVEANSNCGNNPPPDGQTNTGWGMIIILVVVILAVVTAISAVIFRRFRRAER